MLRLLLVYNKYPVTVRAAPLSLDNFSKRYQKSSMDDGWIEKSKVGRWGQWSKQRERERGKRHHASFFL